MNEGRDRDHRMKWVSSEQKIEALQAIFIQNNNNPKFQNEGIINKELVNHLHSRNLITLQEWIDIVKGVKNNLIPKSFQSLKECQ